MLIVYLEIGVFYVKITNLTQNPQTIVFKLMDLYTQKLITILNRAPDIIEAARLCSQHCPDGYVAGGAITQTVWNDLTHQPLGAQIKDIDLVYFDPDRTLADEKQLESMLNANNTLSHKLDLTNEALTHTWYEDKFDASIEPYQCAEEAIDVWLSAFA
ncbi:MAG: nucleotidyltransferase family protein, partial [Pseudomonadota bacterium]